MIIIQATTTCNNDAILREHEEFIVIFLLESYMNTILMQTTINPRVAKQRFFPL